MESITDYRSPVNSEPVHHVQGAPGFRRDLEAKLVKEAAETKPVERTEDQQDQAGIARGGEPTHTLVSWDAEAENLVCSGTFGTESDLAVLGDAAVSVPWMTMPISLLTHFGVDVPLERQIQRGEDLLDIADQMDGQKPFGERAEQIVQEIELDLDAESWHVYLVDPITNTAECKWPDLEKALAHKVCERWPSEEYDLYPIAMPSRFGGLGSLQEVGPKVSASEESVEAPELNFAAIQNLPIWVLARERELGGFEVAGTPFTNRADAKEAAKQHPGKVDVVPLMISPFNITGQWDGCVFNKTDVDPELPQQVPMSLAQAGLDRWFSDELRRVANLVQFTSPTRIALFARWLEKKYYHVAGQLETDDQASFREIQLGDFEIDDVEFYKRLGIEVPVTC